jgi:branched-chain amino acid transport system ATP-binding protein
MSEPVLETHDLSVRFGGVLAVNTVSFTLRERELRCLIGPNGAGKSTFFKSITGQIRGAQSNGRVVIRGQDVTGWSTHRIVRLGIGVKTQVPSVLSGLTVEENLWLAARRALGREGVEAAVDAVVSELELGAIARRQVSELAHGQRQLAEIGIVLLDEPAAGITTAETERLVAIIRRINRSATLIVVDHDMHFVRMLDSHITVFHQGAILLEGRADHVLTDRSVREVYLGSRAR